MPGDTSDPDAVRAAKDEIRADVQRRRRRAGAQPAQDAARTALVLERLGARLPTVVACYCSAGAEPDTTVLIDTLDAAGVSVLLPVLDDPREPDWALHTGQFRLGRRGIPEPVGESLGPEALGLAEVVIVPGLAGAPDGTRLGTGGGWYDRALAHARPDAATWLLLRDDEVVDALPAHAWDRRVSALATPTRWIACPES